MWTNTSLKKIISENFKLCERHTLTDLKILFKNVFVWKIKLQRKREKWGQNRGFPLFDSLPKHTRLKPGAKNSMEDSHKDAESQALEPSPAMFPGMFGGSWIVSRAAMASTSGHVGSLHWKQQLHPLCHNSNFLKSKTIMPRNVIINLLKNLKSLRENDILTTQKEQMNLNIS